jgi:integrase
VGDPIGRRAKLDWAHLRWSNLDLEKGVVRLVTKKTGRSTVLPLSDAPKGHIAALPAPEGADDFVHPHLATLSQSSLSTQFGQLLEAAGLRRSDEADVTSKGGARRRMGELSYHSLRHTAVNLLKDVGIAQATVLEANRARFEGSFSTLHARRRAKFASCSQCFATDLMYGKS